MSDAWMSSCVKRHVIATPGENCLDEIWYEMPRYNPKVVESFMSNLCNGEDLMRNCNTSKITFKVGDTGKDDFGIPHLFPLTHVVPYLSRRIAGATASACRVCVCTRAI